MPAVTKADPSKGRRLRLTTHAGLAPRQRHKSAIYPQNRPLVQASEKFSPDPTAYTSLRLRRLHQEFHRPQFLHRNRYVQEKRVGGERLVIPPFSVRLAAALIIPQQLA